MQCSEIALFNSVMYNILGICIVVESENGTPICQLKIGFCSSTHHKTKPI